MTNKQSQLLLDLKMLVGVYSGGDDNDHMVLRAVLREAAHEIESLCESGRAPTHEDR